MSSAVQIEHIEMTPGVVGGKPSIAGRRISVQDIAIWHERMGQSVDEIATYYELGLSDIYAALTYYYDHRVEIDQSIEASNAFVEAMRSDTPSVLQKKLHEMKHGAE